MLVILLKIRQELLKKLFENSLCALILLHFCFIHSFFSQMYFLIIYRCITHTFLGKLYARYLTKDPPRTFEKTVRKLLGKNLVASDA